MISCDTSMVSGQRGKLRAAALQPVINNFMENDQKSHLKDEADGNKALAPYFHKHEMEIESGYPSESDA